MLRHSKNILIWHYNKNIKRTVLYPSNDDIDTSTDDTTLEFTPEGIILNCEVPAYSKYEKLYYRMGKPSPLSKIEFVRQAWHGLSRNILTKACFQFVFSSFLWYFWLFFILQWLTMFTESELVRKVLQESEIHQFKTPK